VVDGPLSIKCYLQALDKCYQLYCKKKAALLKKCGAACDVPPACDLSAFDAVLFHAPFCKLVQKSLGRLALNDFVRTAKDERIAKFPGLEAFINVELEKSYFDKDVEKAFVQYSSDMFRAKTKPGLLMAENVGNMYTPSLYGGLVSFIISLSLDQLAGKRVGLFSYGSGLVSSFFSLRIADDASEGSRLAQMKRTLKDVEARLNSRIKVSPAEFTEVMLLREKVHHAAPYNPVGAITDLFPHTYYLTGVDERHRRKYDVAKPLQNGHA
jgi:hydroxymethylglutaryl-CoA synthase